jgi:hypothetical protein
VERPGCFVALRDRLVSMVRGAGARTIEEARKQMVGPAAYSTARALERCTRLDEQRRVYMQAVALELVTAPDTGSPRRAVLSAVLAGIQREGGPTPFRGASGCGIHTATRAPAPHGRARRPSSRRHRG